MALSWQRKSNCIFVRFVGWLDREQEHRRNAGFQPCRVHLRYLCPGLPRASDTSQLLKGIEQHLAGLGIARLRIDSLAANKSARASYERAGFAPYEIVYRKNDPDPRLTLLRKP